MRNNSIKIRRFKKSDAEAINRLLMRVFSQYNTKGVSQKGKEFFRERYSKKNIQDMWGKDDYVLIVEEDARLVGVGRAKKDGWISHLYVIGGQMRKGIGQALMQKMENWLKSNNVRHVKLNSSLFALEFYEKLGYKKTTLRRKTYYGIPMYSMKKKLI